MMLPRFAVTVVSGMPPFKKPSLPAPYGSPDLFFARTT
jgi:hypothetical protein